MRRPCEPVRFLSFNVCGEFFQSGQDNSLRHGRKQVLPRAPMPSPDVCNAITKVLTTWPNREVELAARKGALLFYGDERQRLRGQPTSRVRS